MDFVSCVDLVSVNLSEVNESICTTDSIFYPNNQIRL